jgi:hypothetical protein
MTSCPGLSFFAESCYAANTRSVSGVTVLRKEVGARETVLFARRVFPVAAHRL